MPNLAQLAAKATPMRYFRFLIHDSRYEVPTLLFVNVAEEARARELAAQELDKSPHYRSIEVREGEQSIFTISRDRA